MNAFGISSDMISLSSFASTPAVINTLSDDTVRLTTSSLDIQSLVVYHLPFNCTIVFLFDEGGIVVEGFYDDMTIVGSSGCFAGLTGKVRGRVLTDETFEYVWMLD